MEIETEAQAFICGVVEGFYNKPWNQGQRVDLYKKLNTFGLNAYLYAPKDDIKHRALWRDPYDESELQQLKVLMDGCSENDVTFYYGISPGLDMRYSNPKDMVSLKTKLDQLVRIGCKGFAVLWDDIGTQLPSADMEAFNTLADAHVKVCNEVYEHLKRPAFLTCPVEYCADRAQPSVITSPYLNTLGAGLHPSISIFWTGSKVVPEFIYKEEIIELTKVLRRKPLIWDNLHANDYDAHRVFLGPYTGRSPDIIPHLKGVFTNPNCEYSLNIPALSTLAAWSHCYDARTGNISSWNPMKASDLAIPHFLEECHRPTTVSTSISNGMNLSMVSTVTTTVSTLISKPTQVTCSQQPVISDCNSLATSLKDKGSTMGTYGDPSASGAPGDCEDVMLDKDDIELLFHFYWLPHSNGPRAETIVNNFHQLRDYAHIIKKLGVLKSTLDDDDLVELGSGSISNGSSESVDQLENMDMDELAETGGSKAERHLVSTWARKASHFNEISKKFTRIIDKMAHTENREMFFDMYGYLNNLNVILQSCNRYLKCFGVERCNKPKNGELTLAGLPGGLAGELLRLYPEKLNDGNDEYPIERFRTTSLVDPVIVCKLLPKNRYSILGPAFSRLLCESHGIPESEVPKDVIELIRSYRIGAFLAEKDAIPLIVETSSIIQPVVTPLVLPGIAGAASAETSTTTPIPTASSMTASNLFEMPEVGKDDASNNVIAALVGTRSVSNVIKTLQQQFDAARSLDSSHLPIALPTEGGLPWDSLSRYDILMTFAATPKILFTKLLADAFKMFYEITMNPQQIDNSPSSASAPDVPVPCKYGLLMEKTSAISIQFLYDQGFRKIENFSNFIVMEIEMSEFIG